MLDANEKYDMEPIVAGEGLGAFVPDAAHQFPPPLFPCRQCALAAPPKACRWAAPAEFYGDLAGAEYYSVAVVSADFCTAGATFTDVCLRLWSHLQQLAVTFGWWRAVLHATLVPMLCCW
jgi:hypothetical protein